LKRAAANELLQLLVVLQVCSRCFLTANQSVSLQLFRYSPNAVNTFGGCSEIVAALIGPFLEIALSAVDRVDRSISAKPSRRDCWSALFDFVPMEQNPTPINVQGCLNRRFDDKARAITTVCRPADFRSRCHRKICRYACRHRLGGCRHAVPAEAGMPPSSNPDHADFSDARLRLALFDLAKSLIRRQVD
jgi:hypothetical protein